jgi:hypothetical protein
LVIARASDEWLLATQLSPFRLPVDKVVRKETIAGMRRNGRDAPIPDLPALTPERAGSVRKGMDARAACRRKAQEQSSWRYRRKISTEARMVTAGSSSAIPPPDDLS